MFDLKCLKIIYGQEKMNVQIMDLKICNITFLTIKTQTVNEKVNTKGRLQKKKTQKCGL